MDCEVAWTTFFAEASLAEEGVTFDKDALACATWHLSVCATCMVRWDEFVKSNKPSPAPALAPKQRIEDSLLCLIIRVTDLPPERISSTTPLGPLQTASLLIKLTRIGTLARRLRSKDLSPDGMTVGKLAALWKKSPPLVPQFPNREEEGLEVL